MPKLPDRASPTRLAPCPSAAAPTAAAPTAAAPTADRGHDRLHLLAGLVLAAAASTAAGFDPPSLPPRPAPPPKLAPPAIPIPTPLFGDLQVTLNGPTDNGRWFGSVHSTGVTPTIECGTGGACRQTYLNGLQIGLMAAPVAGAVFDGWGGTCSGQASSCGLRIAGGEIRNVQARFAPAQLQVELVGPVGMATDLRFQANTNAALWAQRCTRSTMDSTCTYDLPLGATHVDVLPQPVESRFPTLSCSGAASCQPTVSNSLRVSLTGLSSANRIARVRLDLGLNGQLLVHKVTGPDCALADTSRSLTVAHSGGGPTVLIAPGVAAARVAVPLGGTATLTAAPGVNPHWLGCIGSNPRSGALVQATSCRVDLASNPTLVTACMPN